MGRIFWVIGFPPVGSPQRFLTPCGMRKIRKIGAAQETQAVQPAAARADWRGRLSPGEVKRPFGGDCTGQGSYCNVDSRCCSQLLDVSSIRGPRCRDATAIDTHIVRGTGAGRWITAIAIHCARAAFIAASAAEHACQLSRGQRTRPRRERVRHGNSQHAALPSECRFMQQLTLYGSSRHHLHTVFQGV